MKAIKGAPARGGFYWKHVNGRWEPVEVSFLGTSSIVRIDYLNGVSTNLVAPETLEEVWFVGPLQQPEDFN